MIDDCRTQPGRIMRMKVPQVLHTLPKSNA